MVFIDDEKKRATLVKRTSPGSSFHIAIQRPSMLPFWETCYHLTLVFSILKTLQGNRSGKKRRRSRCMLSGFEKVLMAGKLLAELITHGAAVPILSEAHPAQQVSMRLFLPLWQFYVSCLTAAIKRNIGRRVSSCHAGCVSSNSCVGCGSESFVRVKPESSNVFT
jgi:hypothetical protein